MKNPTDTAITDYFQQKNYETEGDNLDAGKQTYFLRLITGIVSGVGLFISILSFYILMLSVFLLLQKNTAKLENLLLIGYSPSKVALPYHVLTVGLNLLVLLLAVIGVVWLRSYYTGSPANSYSTTGNRLSSALYPHRKYLIYSGIRFKHPPDTKESSLHLERKQRKVKSMIKRKITKVIVACLMLLFLLSTGIFIFRGSLLRHIADKRIVRLEQRYGLDISYNKLHMKGLNTISIDGLNVVPQKRDTLLSLQPLNIRIGLWKLLWGDIKIKEVRLDGLSLNFIKKTLQPTMISFSCPLPR